MKTSKPPRAIARAFTPADDDELLSHLRANTYFDSVELSGRDGWTSSTRLFGNANIGYYERCNLQVPGQLVNGAFVITNWYARTDAPIGEPQVAGLWNSFAHRTMCTLRIGDKPRWQANVYDLMRSWRGTSGDQRALRPLWPVVVPHRQYVSVMADFFGDNGYLLQMLDSTGYGWSAEPGRSFRLWIHLEGLSIPEYSEYDGTDAEKEAHWRHFTGRVMRLLTRSEKEVVSTAEHVARWIGVYGDEATDPAIKHAAAVIGDAVREQRHRGIAPSLTNKHRGDE
ncbi:MAG TPA: hypothetical protein VFD36_20670 [Kofleriaceae bacterium]|nr:hypothetical protein [Kofleriaceae bacterium]